MKKQWLVPYAVHMYIAYRIIGSCNLMVKCKICEADSKEVRCVNSTKPRWSYANVRQPNRCTMHTLDRWQIRISQVNTWFPNHASLSTIYYMPVFHKHTNHAHQHMQMFQCGWHFFSLDCKLVSKIQSPLDSSTRLALCCVEAYLSHALLCKLYSFDKAAAAVPWFKYR